MHYVNTVKGHSYDLGGSLVKSGIRTNRIAAVTIIILMLVVGCSQPSITIDDLYLESWTALQALKHGNFKYIPAHKDISVTSNNNGTQIKIDSSSIINGREMTLHLIYPSECIIKNDKVLFAANKEFNTIKKCVDKFTSNPTQLESCSVSAQIYNGENATVIQDRANAPHMDVWIYDVD